MYIEKITGSVRNLRIPSGIDQFLGEGEIYRLKWRFKFWKRWLFAFVIIEWLGIVKRIDRIESKHRRILWINLAAPSLGDSLMDLSARPLLVDRNVDLLSHPKNICLYQKDPWFCDVADDPSEFKKRDYDLVICDAFSPRVLIQKLLIAPLTPYVGLYEFVNGFEVHRTYFSFGRMMELLDLRSTDSPLRPTICLSGPLSVTIPPVDVCVAVGGEWAFRTYQNWRQIISWLVRNGYSVSLVGSENGIEMSEEIVASEPSVRSTVGTLSLQEVVGEIAGAKLFIGADGGLWHIACAIPKPTVVLFADCQIFDEEGHRVTRETTDMVCETLYDDVMVSNISPDSVIAAFQRLWTRTEV